MMDIPPGKEAENNVLHHTDCTNDHDGNDAAHTGSMLRELPRAGARSERKRPPHELGRGHRRRTKPPDADAMEAFGGLRR